MSYNSKTKLPSVMMITTQYHMLPFCLLDALELYVVICFDFLYVITSVNDFCLVFPQLSV